MPVRAQDWALRGSGYVCVGPRCQCVGQKTVKRMTRAQVCGRQVRCPEWVVTNALYVDAVQIDPLDCSPRHRVVEAERRPPLRLQGVPRFASSGGCVRCTVDESLASQHFICVWVHAVAKKQITLPNPILREGPCCRAQSNNLRVSAGIVFLLCQGLH